MNIGDFRAKLHDLGVDVPEQVVKNWAYSDHVIEAPVPTKHGKGSGIRGRAAAWDEEDIPNVAAVYALRHHPTVKYRPMLELVPDIRRAVQMTYDMPTAGYDVTPPITSYKDIKMSLQGRPEHLRERIPEYKWQALLLTWIAAREKAKRGIRIDVPKQVRFNWHSVEKDGLRNHIPVEVDDSVKDNKHVALYPSESGHDEMIVIIDGSDFRETVANLFSGKYRIVDRSG